MSADVDTAVARFLAGVDALGWNEPDRVRYVRTFLEDGIDALARAEDARFDFLAHCAQLASDNMQDARLHVADERLAELENPDSDASVEAFFVELAIILALELAVVATATIAIPALIAFVAAGARTRAVRKVVAQAGVDAGPRGRAWKSQAATGHAGRDDDGHGRRTGRPARGQRQDTSGMMVPVVEASRRGHARPSGVRGGAGRAMRRARRW